jgi:hypothetical protein
VKWGCELQALGSEKRYPRRKRHFEEEGNGWCIHRPEAWSELAKHPGDAGLKPCAACQIAQGKDL